MTAADPFSVLGVEPKFSLDLSELERRHRELSRALHPDRYVGRPAGERRLALGRAIEVNQAWRVLKDPVERAFALLRQLRVVVEEGRSLPADPELLEEIMALREDLAGTKARRDRSGVARLRATVAAREGQALLELERRFSILLDSEIRGAVDGARATPVLTTLGEIRYLGRFLEEAAAIEDEWGD